MLDVVPGNAVVDVAEIPAAALRSKYYDQVSRRILRQLAESLIYEKLIDFDERRIGDFVRYIIHCEPVSGAAIRYEFLGHKRYGFDRFRLKEDSFVRHTNEKLETNISISEFVQDVESHLGTEKSYVKKFTSELERTLLNDTIAQYSRWQEKRILRNLSYNEIEGALADGHPYHPCYKSRVGFNLEDNFDFSSEFQNVIAPVLLAAHQSIASIEYSEKLNVHDFYSVEFSEELIERFRSSVAKLGRSTTDYHLVPVHPWQWKNVIVESYTREIQNGQLIYLGGLMDKYVAQQSIRTLTNTSAPNKSYLKFPLSIQNTSTLRILSPHTVKNAAIISDWLSDLCENDPFLSQDNRVVLLKEVMGVTVNQEMKDSSSPSYGALSCIWRESLMPHLKAGEKAMPFSALSYIDGDQKPAIDEWMAKYDVKEWVTHFLKVTTVPLIHLLYHHGVALEAHGQNTILIHHDGWPVGVALKDFHDGVRYKSKLLKNPQNTPEIYETPGSHLNINRNSYIHVDSSEYIRDFLLDSVYFINLSEISYFLERNYQFPEIEFWRIAKEIIFDYQSDNPDLVRRFDELDLFAPSVEVEQLTKRRLFPDDGTRTHWVSNPLA